MSLTKKKKGVDGGSSDWPWVLTIFFFPVLLKPYSSKVECDTLGYATKIAPELLHEPQELFSSLPEITQALLGRCCGEGPPGSLFVSS